jgi:hypothetical protein
MSSLFSFPQDIFYLFANYLLAKDDQNKKSFHFSYDWRNFMNTSKEYFAEWKKESQIISLNGKFAERFHKSSQFRDRILQTIQNPRFQLEVSFIFPNGVNRRPVINLKRLNGVRSLHIEECKLRKIELLDVEELVLVGCNVSDLAFCANIKKMCYRRGQNSDHPIVDISCLKSLEDFSLFMVDAILNFQMLSNLKKLSFFPNQHISDLSCLQNVRSLYFVGCNAITDVRCLAHVSELTLSLCRGITDVSSLGNVLNLTLHGCENIRDVSALGNVHTLDLSACSNVVDISGLTNVHSLTIRAFQGTDLSGLRNVVILDISNSPNVRDISCLTNVRSLNVTDSMKIHDFTGLYRLKELIALHPLVVTRGMEIIRQLHTLQIGQGSYPNPGAVFIQEKRSKISNINISRLTNLLTLELHSCTTLGLVPDTLTKLRSLTIEDCDDFYCIPSLPASLGRLSVTSCRRLELVNISKNDDISVFPLYYVEIEGCDRLKKIEVRRKVFFMKVEQCESLKRMEIATQVDRLRLSTCPELQSIIGLKNIVSFYDEDSKEVYEEDPIEPGEEEEEDESDNGSEEEDDESEEDEEDSGDSDELDEFEADEDMDYDG